MIPPVSHDCDVIRALRVTALKEQEYADDLSNVISAAIHTSILNMLERFIHALEHPDLSGEGIASEPRTASQPTKGSSLRADAPSPDESSRASREEHK